MAVARTRVKMRERAINPKQKLIIRDTPDLGYDEDDDDTEDQLQAGKGKGKGAKGKGAKGKGAKDEDVAEPPSKKSKR